MSTCVYNGGWKKIWTFRQQPIQLLDEMASEYSDYDFFKIAPFSRNIYFVLNPTYCQDILFTKHDHLKKSKTIKLLSPLLGEGLLTSDGDKHKKHRKLMQPAFHKDSISSYMDQMVAITKSHIGRWNDGETYPIHSEITEMTLNIITATMFGDNIGPEQFQEIQKRFDYVLDWFPHKARSIFPTFDLPTKRARRYQQAIDYLNEIVIELIEQRRHLKEERNDLLDMLLAAQDDEGIGFTYEELREEVMTIFLAGHDTTTNQISWVLYQLTQSPQVLKKIVDEVDRVLQGRDMTMSDLPQLTYTRQVISETMRLYPAVQFIDREVKTPFEMGGHHFKAGETIVIPIYCFHRNPKFYDQPLEFRPERFTPTFMKDQPKFTYLPFGSGARMCIGHNFAWMELFVIVCTILQHFQFQLREGEVVKPHPIITLRPSSPLPMIVNRRKSVVASL